MNPENTWQNLKEGMYTARILYSEKGISPFRLPLLVLISVFMLLYMGVHKPIISKLQRDRSEMDSLNASTQYASVFNKHRSWLISHQKELPPIKDKDNWLFNAVARASQQEGIATPTISQQTEREVNDFVVVNRKISAVTTFKKAAKWIEKIENLPFLVRISNLSIQKSANKIGFVKLKFQVDTVFMKSKIGEEMVEPGRRTP